MTLSQKSKIKNQNDKSKSKNLAFPFSAVARHDSAEEKILRLPRFARNDKKRGNE